MSSLDGFKTMRRTYPIQIQAADMSGVNEYQVYQERCRNTEHKLIASRVSEDQVEALLTEREYQKFQKGAFRFRVTGQQLCDVLQALPF